MPTLHIQLYGAFQVMVDDQPWDEFRSDKVRALLELLDQGIGKSLKTLLAPA